MIYYFSYISILQSAMERIQVRDLKKEEVHTAAVKEYCLLTWSS